MRISVVGPVYPYRGGIAHYTTSLALALREAGHDVKVFSFKRQYPTFLYPGETDKDPSTDPLRIEANYLLDPIYPWTWRQTAKIILKTEPDLILIQWWTTFWAPAFTALSFQIRNKVRVAYTIHNVYPHENRFWDRWLARLALGLGHAFIVQAPHEQEKLAKLLPHARIHYCNLPVYQRFSELSISKEVARQQLGLPKDCPVFLFFGIVRPYKGLKYLIEALKQVDTHVHLVIAGEFWEDFELYTNQIINLGLGEKITIFNKYIPNEEAHILFSSADVLVAPYIGGTQSAAVGVSLGYGLPAIVTEKIATGIDLGTPGIEIVPAGNVAALADALLKYSNIAPELHPKQPSGDNWGRMVKTIEDLLL